MTLKRHSGPFMQIANTRQMEELAGSRLRRQGWGKRQGVSDNLCHSESTPGCPRPREPVYRPPCSPAKCLPSMFHMPGTGQAAGFSGEQTMCVSCAWRERQKKQGRPTPARIVQECRHLSEG